MLSTLRIVLLILTFLPQAFSRAPTCLPERRRPVSPSVSDCQTFLDSLARDARAEPRGAYNWYGRDLDPSPGFVRLPTIIRSGREKCATLIDVDEEEAKEVSVFGLEELAVSLAEMITYCWVIRVVDGKGWPGGGQSAWAMFASGYEWVAAERWGNRTVSVMDLDEVRREDKASG